MARTVKEIEDEIISSVAADETLKTRLDSTSATALWRLYAYVFAFAANILERLYDTLLSEINELISKLKPHTIRWYAEKVKAFQYGFPLPPDTDVYDNSLVIQSLIDASKIVKYAAVTRGRRTNGRVFLRIK